MQRHVTHIQCIYVYIHAHADIYLHVYMHIYIYVNVDIHVYVNTYIYVHIRVYSYVYVCVYIYTYCMECRQIAVWNWGKSSYGAHIDFSEPASTTKMKP